MTGDDGRFRIEYAPVADHRVWSVTVEVMIDGGDGPEILYRDAKARTPAGVVESYSIRIGYGALAKARLHVPHDGTAPALARTKSRLLRAAENAHAAELLAKETKARVEADRARKMHVEARVALELMARLRATPPPTGSVHAEQVAKTADAIAELADPDIEKTTIVQGTPNVIVEDE